MTKRSALLVFSAVLAGWMLALVLLMLGIELELFKDDVWP